MSLENIHLRKLLKIFYLPQNLRRAALRADIREDMAREGGGVLAGGDFYGPFWRDAKDHVIGAADLHDCVSRRVESNPRRENLYPRLRDGFLLWWNERRRWTNEPFRPVDGVKGRHEFNDLGAVVKVDNILSVRDASDEDHFIYPYFSPDPVLGEEGARLGLWLIGEALDNVPLDEIRILDVIRGQTFSVDRTPLAGNEEQVFTARYRAILNEWRGLWSEYE
jgi:hypothetical protein